MTGAPWGLEGKAALVTGGASGIGAALAEALAEQGARVRIADIRPAAATLAAIAERGGQADAVRVDLREEEAVDRMAAAAAEDMGGIDLYVNVAARWAFEPVTALTCGTWNDILATNLTACALACRTVARRMIRQGSGSILIVGSTVTCAPAYGQAAYRASKAALRSYMETLAIELAPFGIRVNMLTPGPFPTALAGDLPAEARAAAVREVPLGQREGRLEELGPAALLLLSDRLASFITGAELTVDGGLHLRPLYVGDAQAVRALNA